MGLREEYDRLTKEKSSKDGKAQKYRGKDALLCEEVRRLYSGEPPGECKMQEDGGMYFYSSPIQLPPESLAMIQELIELYPAWKKYLPANMPVKADISDIQEYENADTLDYSYRFYPHYLQYRLTDGSVHIGIFELFAKESAGPKSSFWVSPKYRFTMRGKKEAALEAENAMCEAWRQAGQQTKVALLQEVQRTWAQRFTNNPMITGSQEYFIIEYESIRSHRWAADYGFVKNHIVVFRDGTVYDPYPRDKSSDGGDFFERRLEHPASTTFLYQKCSELIRRWV